MSAPGQAHEHEHSTKPYYMVFGALLVLTVVTVALSGVDLGYAGNKILGVIVAVVKATLVLSIFMHLKQDAKDRYILIAVLFPVCLFCLLVAACCPDIVFRGGDQSKRFDPAPWDKTHFVEPAEGGAHDKPAEHEHH